MYGYYDKHTRDTYKLYNPNNNRVIISRDINWLEWKMIDPAKNMKMFCSLNEDNLVPSIKEYKTPT